MASDLTNSSEGEDYEVTLPVSPDKFADFVAGLLGSPQTYEKIYHKAFELDRQKVESTFHLVDQRVRQQNDASLVQFSVRMSYDDDSSVLLDSLQDFLAYSEVKPLVVESLRLIWVYLIRFQDRAVPEKQTIELAFQIDGSGGLVHVEDDVHVISRRSSMPSHIRTRIVHTARTWATDIDSLLDGHIKTLTTEIGGFRSWLTRHDGSVALITGLLFLLIYVGANYLAISEFVEQQTSAVSEFLIGPGGVAPSLDEKVERLLNMAVDAESRKFSFVTSGLLIVSLPIALLLGVWAGSSADNRRSSFLLLSEKSMSRKKEKLRKSRRQWISLFFAFLASIAAGFIANWIFQFAINAWFA